MSTKLEMKSVDDEILQSINLYGFGYGMWKEGTLITDALGVHPENPYPGKAIDRRKRFASLIRKKAVLDSTAAIIHTTTDQQIVDTTRREAPLQELIPMETARGKVAAYDVLQSRGGVNSNAFVTETVTSLSAESDTYVNATVTLAIEQVTGGWTDFGLAGAAGQYPSRDLRALEIRNKTWTQVEAHEHELANGMLSGPAPAGLNLSIGFTGIRTTANNVSGNTGTLGLRVSKGGVVATFGDIDTVVWNMVQLNVKPNLAVTDGITWQNLKHTLMSWVDYTNPETEIAWGLRALAWYTPYGMMPLIASKFYPTTANNREIDLLDTKFVAQRVLLDSTFELLAKTTLQQTFVVKKFVAYIDKTDRTPNTFQGSGTSKMGSIAFIA